MTSLLATHYACPQTNSLGLFFPLWCPTHDVNADFLTTVSREQTSPSTGSRNLECDRAHHGHTYVISHRSQFIRNSFSTWKLSQWKGTVPWIEWGGWKYQLARRGAHRKSSPKEEVQFFLELSPVQQQRREAKAPGYGGYRFHCGSSVQVGGGSSPTWLRERGERVRGWDQTPLTMRVCTRSREQDQVTTLLF